MIVFMANVGERDLYYNVGTPDEPYFCHFRLGEDDEIRVANHLGSKNGARYISEKILQRLDRLQGEAQRLRYPILKTVMCELLTGSDMVIDKVVLVGTDQPQSTEERHRRRDTINTAKVLQELIKMD